MRANPIGRLACLIALSTLATILTAELADGAPRPAHRRLETSNGPVHVWSPAEYDRDRAGIVVYIHGYFTDVDDAWRKHRLARQFQESALNALFVACEAPRSSRDEVNWPSIMALLDEVSTATDDPLPDGRIVVVGHSGAHRTITRWIGGDPIDTVVLVDALYGEMQELREWLDADDEHRLIDAARLTRRWGDKLHAEISDTLVFDKFPPARSGKLRGARNARVVYVHSQYDHMGLVTGGVALPMLLRAARIPVVKDASRRAPIRRL